MRIVTIVSVLVLLLDHAAALKIDDYSDTACIISAYPATKPMGLEFCYWYNDNSCCVPQLDSDAMEIYGNTVNLGLSCSVSKHSIKVTYHPIREWFCLGCDPNEPKYRFKKSVGDKHLAGGQHDPDTSADSKAVTWRVCKSFLTGTDGNSGLWGNGGHMYDQCGILMENPCNGGKQVVWNPKMNNGDGAVTATQNPVLDGWDPFMCGDNLIIPSKEYINSENAGKEFLAAMAPPGFGDVDFSFVVTDDTKADFVYDSTPCFRGLSGALGLLPSLTLTMMMVVVAVLLLVV
eukprot:PhM_4_TR1473/c0_g1_i1/m.5075